MTPSPQTPTSNKTLIQQLKPVLGSILDSARSQFALLQAPLNPNTPDESLILHQKTHVPSPENPRSLPDLEGQPTSAIR